MTNRKKRLELTWIGNEERPRLEPRILLEEQDLSYAKRVSEDDSLWVTLDDHESHHMKVLCDEIIVER